MSEFIAGIGLIGLMLLFIGIGVKIYIQAKNDHSDKE